MTLSTIEKYVSEFGSQKTSKSDKSIPWLETLRKKAVRSIDANGFPHARHEEWKYTDISKIRETYFRPVHGEPPSILWKQLNDAGLDLAGTIPFIFIDGRFTPLFSDTLNLPKGIKIASLQQVLSENPNSLKWHLSQFSESSATVFSDLNTAFINDGAFIQIGQNTVLPDPIQLVFISTSQAEPILSQPRNLIILKERAQATVIQNFIGLTPKNDYLNNVVTEISLAEDAKLTHLLVQEENQETFHVNTIQVRQASNSRFDSHTFTFGGALTRNNLNIELGAEGAECNLNGLFMIDGEQHVDNHTRIDHLKPNCNSKEYYKGILDSSSRGVFNGKVYVHPKAQKTNAFQKNPNLLLSKNAEMDTKPQLEIFADDVKCSHGATVGQLDESAIFYLRSRGLEKSAARDLMIYSFAEEMIQQIRFEPLRHHLTKTLAAKLPEADGFKEIS